MLRLSLILILWVFSLDASAQWDNLIVKSIDQYRPHESSPWENSYMHNRSHDAYGNEIKVQQYEWNGQTWLLRHERSREFDKQNRLISSHSYSIQNRQKTTEEYVTYEFAGDQIVGRKWVSINNIENYRYERTTNGIWGEGIYRELNESFENDELISSLESTTEFNRFGMPKTSESRLYDINQGYEEYRQNDHYNDQGCFLGSISLANRDGSGYLPTDSVRMVHILGCDVQFEEYRYRFDNREWQEIQAFRYANVDDQNGNRLSSLLEQRTATGWDTLTLQTFRYSSRGDLVEYYDRYIDHEFRISYSFSFDYLQFSTIHRTKKVSDSDWETLDSTFTFMHNETQVANSRSYSKENDIFKLTNEVMNEYDENDQVVSVEYYTAWGESFNRERVDFIRRCDGMVQQWRRSTIDNSNPSQIGEQWQSQNVYLRNDGCQENTSEQFVVYPNPADQYLAVQLPIGIRFFNLRVIQTNGQVMYSTSFESDIPYYRLDSSNLAEGMYIIELTSEGIRSSQQIVIDH